MKSALLPIPGIMLGTYPERKERRGAMPQDVTVSAGSGRRHTSRHYQQLARRATALAAQIASLNETEFNVRLAKLRSAIALNGFSGETIVEALALVSRVAHTSLGKQPYETQLTAAAIMLDGKLAEMATGEGKTLAAALCAATAALAGIPVHVMTANDYLVERDAKALEPLYRALGLSVGSVSTQMDRDTRCRGYACNVTYCTARQLAFDYLRDRLMRGQTRDDLVRRAAGLGSANSESSLLRGLCMAIVDEADSILIDEAGVPLIISENVPDKKQLGDLRDALRIASELDSSHFRLQRGQMQAELTDAGRTILAQHLVTANHGWHNRRHCEEMVCLALAALHLYQRDTHYLVRDDKVEIIDETTGRLAVGRQWSRGLHQLIETKEGCTPRSAQATAAQITYQRFFRRYLHLAGLSGTLSEACSELRAVYGLKVVNVPLRLPCRRSPTTIRLHATRESCWQAVTARTLQMRQTGRPVLIGTGSVADSEQLSKYLTVAGIEHAVLNARQDAAEAQLVGAAGQAGQVTVATNMAGRGTDIELGVGVAGRGGLHVISCQHNASARIDRQLIGRCARQGEPGSAEILLCADSPMLTRWIPSWLRQRIAANGLNRPQSLLRQLLRAPQFMEEMRRRDQRHALLLRDQQSDRGRSFGRPAE